MATLIKEMDDKFVELTENENITKLCEEVNLSSYLIFLLVWFLLGIYIYIFGPIIQLLMQTDRSGATLTL